ncbi:MAG: hypothetical protein ACI4X9_02475 [Kiritimatiellia bacterium]
MHTQPLITFRLPALCLGLCLAAASPLRADTLIESFDLTAAVRSAVSEGVCQAPVIEEKGSYAGYPASNLFDGINYSTSTNKECRWLAVFKSPNEGDQCFVTYRVPDDYRPDEAFALQYYTLSRNAVADYDYPRSPTLWSIYGIDDDGTETLITTENNYSYGWMGWVAATPTADYRHGTYIPTPTYRGYRAFKFVPHQTASSDSVNCGFCELALGVRPVPRQPQPIFDLATDLRNTLAQGLCSQPTVESLGAHGSYPAERLFDGISYSFITNASRRWIAKYTQPNTGDQCFVTYRLPDDYRPGQRFLLRQYTLYRTAANAIDLARVPLEWAIYGISDNGQDELITQNARTYESWGNQDYNSSDSPDQILLPDLRQATYRLAPSATSPSKAYRAFKFIPIQTAAPASEGWKCGLVELSLAVEAVTPELPTLILFR